MPRAGLLERETAHAAHVAAGFWLRVIAAGIDAAIVFILYAMCLFVLLVTVVSPHGLASWLRLGSEIELLWRAWLAAFSMATLALLIKSLLLLAMKYLIALGMYVLYFGAFESYLGATPGKLALGLAVIERETRMPLSFPRALMRNAAKLLSALPAGLGFVMAAFTVEKQAFHDIVSGCVVCRQPPAALPRIGVAAAAAIVLAVLGFCFHDVTQRALVARAAAPWSAPAPLRPSPAQPQVSSARLGELVPASAAATPQQLAPAAITQSMGFAEINGDRIELKYALALLDLPARTLDVYLFSEKHEPKGEVDIATFIARADVSITLTFGEYQGTFGNDALTSYLVSFNAQPDGFALEGGVASVDFVRPGTWRHGAGVAELGAAVQVGKTMRAVIRDEGRWVKNRRAYNFRWQLDFSAAPLDKKILPPA